MTDLIFGQIPAGAVATSRPHKPTPCELPHFTEDGRAKEVGGQVYRWAGGSQVLCTTHGKALIERVAENAKPVRSGVDVQ